MTEGLPEVPGWIDELIEYDDDRTMQDHHIVGIFLRRREPFLSMRQLESESTITRQQLDERVGNLVELGVLDSCMAAGGRIYWIRDDRSSWPIPPDVEVEPVEENDDLTVSELLERRYAMAWGLAVSVAFIASILLTVFIASVSFSAPIPDWMAEMMLLGGGVSALSSVGIWITGLAYFIYDRFV